jgi:hypothetical protein
MMPDQMAVKALDAAHPGKNIRARDQDLQM